MSQDSFHIPATAYLQALQRQRVDHFVTVPDWVQLALHTRVEAGVPGLRSVTCSNEDQALCVAAGLHIAGKRPIVVIQNQGLFAGANALRALTLDARLPLVLLIGQFGREFANFGQSPTLSRRSMVRHLEPLLDALAVRHWRLERESDMGHVDLAFEHAYREGAAAALIVGAPTAWQ